MHKCCICSIQNDLDQGFPTTYYMWHYIDYMKRYSIFFKGYTKTAFTQVLYTRHKPQIHKSRIHGTRIGINHGFLMTYYMCHYVKYIQHYKAFFKGYPKTAFTQVLYMCHKLQMQWCCICSIQNDLDQGFTMTYYMWH